MNNYLLEPANYKDYRDFLFHRFEGLKQANKNFSLNYCAQKSNISKSLLQFIFKKKRHISMDRLPGLAKTLKLNSDEEYFVYLMLCKDANSNPTIKDHFEKILSRIRHEYVKNKEPEPEQEVSNHKQLYLNNLAMILHAMIKLDCFKEDPEWIIKNLNINGLTITQIQNTLKQMENLNFISRDPSGRLTSNPQKLWRPDPYDPNGFNVFKNATESLAILMKNAEIYKPSVYMSMALPMDEKYLLEAEKYMIEVHHHLVELSKKSIEPTAVAYFGNYFLTLARIKFNNN